MKGTQNAFIENYINRTVVFTHKRFTTKSNCPIYYDTIGDWFRSRKIRDQKQLPYIL